MPYIMHSLRLWWGDSGPHGNAAPPFKRRSGGVLRRWKTSLGDKAAEGHCLWALLVGRAGAAGLEARAGGDWRLHRLREQIGSGR